MRWGKRHCFIALVLYLVDFNLVACSIVSFHLIVVLKQNVNISSNLDSDP